MNTDQKAQSAQRVQQLKTGEGVYLQPEDIHKLTQEVPQKLTLKVASRQASKRLGYRLTRLRGRGMSFAESRAYQPGDEIRHIDWRITARTGQTHTKTFEEERDRPVFIVLDQTTSQYIGSERCFKAYLAAELAVLCAWLAYRGADRFGGLFVGQQALFAPVKSGRKHWAHFCQNLVQVNQQWGLEQESVRMDWQSTLEGTRREARPGSLIVLISDFFQSDSITEQAMYQLRAHSDVLCLATQDPLEVNPPQHSGMLSYGQVEWLYHGDGEDRQMLRRQYEQRWQHIQTLCKRLGIGFVPISTTTSALKSLQAILR